MFFLHQGQCGTYKYVSVSNMKKMPSDVGEIGCLAAFSKRGDYFV